MTFLQEVTSRAGKNLITGPHKTRVTKDGRPIWVEKWVDFSNEEATDLAVREVLEQCKGTYFALGAFKPAELSKRGFARRAANCVALNAFWFDIDCGEAKWQKHNGQGVYRTRKDGQDAFAAFVKSSGMPPPTHIINSGEGFHVYWQLERELPLDEWRQFALAIKAITTYYGFMVDQTRTADAASVLRVPGTLHQNGSTVAITFQSNVPVPISHIQAFVDRNRPYINSPVFTAKLEDRVGLGKRPDYLKDNSESTLDEQELQLPRKFENIIKRSELDGSGCNQLWQMYKHQEHVPEPMWGGALSIAKFCLDGEDWAIKMSENHPEFDPQLTLKKMEQWQAPRTCLWFSEENPDGCKGCPHLTGIKATPTQSPIRLAVDDNRVPTVVQEQISGSGTEYTEDFIIPALPFPYYRDPKLGGVWVTSDDGPRCVYDMDLYIYDRIGVGADNKPRFWIRQHTPYDGVSEIELSSDDLYASGASFLQKLAGYNILVPPDSSHNEISRYLRQCAAHLQRSRAITKPPKQLGWTEKGSFVLGRWEYTQAGRKMSPIQDTNIARMFREACETPKNAPELIDGWNDAIRKLYGAEDAGLYRLILAAGFGSPIRCKYGSEVGGIINIYSEDSGFGKSTLTKVISGIFANSPDPFFYQARQGTTINAFFEIISYVNSLPMTLDETGQLEVEDLMLFIHTCTSGKAKARSSHQVNDVRAALPGWRTHVFSSSNISLWNRITEQRVENEAYLMRVLEIPIKALKQSEDKNYGDDAVKAIQQYYGVAGQTLIEYILRNDEEVAALWHTVSHNLTTRAKLHGRHRFWGDIMTAAVVGAKIASDAGVYPFDPKEIYTLAGKMLCELVERANNKVVQEEDLLGEMINYYIDSTLVLKNTRGTMAIKSPPKRAYVRVEQEEGFMYIDNLALKEFARFRHFGVERVEVALLSVGGDRKAYKQMWANTEFSQSSPAIKCWRINLRDPRMQAFLNRGLLNEAGNLSPSSS